MEKKLYELKINESLEQVIPPLQEAELSLLTQKLLAEGCLDALIVWKETGEIVDGHNRYRICHENGIPFSYVEMPFASENEAKTWIIRHQLGRRNIPDFVKCELVLPLEAELKAEAKKRQVRKPADFVKDNCPEQKIGIQSRDELGKLAGVSGKTMMKAKKLIESADDETKEKLRNGELSIHGAYKTMTSNLKPKENPDIGQRREATWGDIIPGYGLEEILGNSDLPKGYTPPPSTALDITPINGDGTDPEDELACEESLGTDLARSYITSELDRHEHRMLLIFSKMRAGSDQEMKEFHEMIENSCKRILEQFKKGAENEQERGNHE